MDDLKPRHPGGTPITYHPDYCHMLIEHMAGGYSYESFAGVLSISLDTLYYWERVEPQFYEAKRSGIQKARLFWEKVSLENLISTKEGSLNSSVWIFSMKNRFGWKDKLEIAGDESKPLTLNYCLKKKDSESES